MLHWFKNTNTTLWLATVTNLALTGHSAFASLTTYTMLIYHMFLKENLLPKK